ncbi:MAG: DUF4270 domain-containing protein [Mariniphaga sp.]|nr:DUF4270 domain-containing protein [Mariniphaga sp.]
MKRKITIKYHLIAWTITTLAFFTACNEPNDLGMELLPTTDLIEVKNLVEKNSISSFTYTDDPIPTDEPSKSLLGSFYDPVFGKTTINFATQFRLQDFPEYGTNPEADSVKLFLYYRLIYGDTITPQKFRIYELESPLDVDQNYNQDVNLKELASTQLIGEVDYTPVVRQDSASQDTFYQLITIPLDNSLGQKLVDADSLQMINNDVFLEYFKGLYIEAEEQTTTGGTILTLEAAASSSFQGSALVVYYNNDENKAEDEPDTLLNPYVISRFSARVNSIEHDYSGTPFEANLNVDSGNDSLIYVQATGGLKSKIYIDGLTSWKDSANIGINKAELVFQIDTIASEVDKYTPPLQLLFTVLDEEGTEFLPSDYSFSSAYYGGGLRSDYTYRFNITQHMQQIIDGIAENHGFFLTTARKNSEANRVVLKGSNSQTGIKLVITYSKFLE